MLGFSVTASLARRWCAGVSPQGAAALALVLSVAGGMAAWTWNCWADPIVDFGREAYVAWRLSCGDHLYADVAYFNGPLSPAINALAMRLGGPSLAVLYGLNAVILAAISAMVYRLIAQLAGWRCGAACTTVFWGWFACGLFTHIRGFNYLAPYSHEMTHGIALSLAGMCLLKSWSDAPRQWQLIMTGVLLGLLFLTKPEIFVAAAIGYGAAIGLASPASASSCAKVRSLAIVGSAAAAVWLIAALLLGRYLPWQEAWHCSLGAWPHVANADIRQMTFYRWVLGLDDPPFRIATLTFWLLLQGLAVRVGWRAAWKKDPSRSGIGWKLDVVMLGVALAIAVAYSEAPRYANALATAPVWMLGSLAAGWIARETATDEATRRRLAFGLAFAVFALALLAKTPLNTNIFHYGFVLAMPATLLAIAAFWLAAEHVGRRGGSAWKFAAPLLTLWCVIGGIHLVKMSQVVHYYNDAAISAGNLVGPRTHEGEQVVFQEMLAQIERRIAPEQTLAVWPQGAMVNVLSRRKNPTPYIVLLPPEIEMFGEEKIRAAYDEHRPDFILLVHCDTRFYGQGWFGAGYATGMQAWLERHYAPVAAAGAKPFTSTDFGMVLLQRDDAGRLASGSHWSK